VKYKLNHGCVNDDALAARSQLHRSVLLLWADVFHGKLFLFVIAIQRSPGGIVTALSLTPFLLPFD